MDKFTFYTQDGGEAELPTRYEVCWRCRGTGKHVNPSIDGNGISMEQFAEDPDFAEEYLSGTYDVRCYECNGLRVTLEADEEHADPALLAEYHAYLKDEAASRREEAMERRMGA